MKTVLLTGSSGFIGSHVCDALWRNNYSIIAPVRKPNRAKDCSQDGNVVLLEGLFFESSLLKEYEKYQPEVILHMAAIRGEGFGKWDDYYRVNVSGTENLVNYALKKKIKLFIYVSSVGVYGTIPQNIPASTSAQLNPDNNYHRSKYEAEKIVIEKLSGRVPYIILRPTITYGTADNGFLSKLSSMVAGNKFILPRARVRIHLLDVNLFTATILQILERATGFNQIFNVADRHPVLLSEVVEVLSEMFRKKEFPGFLKQPQSLFHLGEKILHFIGMSQLETSLKLISRSWTYDVEDYYRTFNSNHSGTLEAIRRLYSHPNG